MLRVDGISYQRGDEVIVRDLNLRVMPGEFLQLVGPNGSGKSTILKLIAGILRPSSGTIRLQRNNSMLLTECKQIIYLGHEDALHPRLTVSENLQYLRMLFADLYEAEQNTTNALNYLNLHSIADKQCFQLSAGQKQRVSLARLYSCTAKVWLLDEIWVNLDQAALEKLHTLCKTHLATKGIIIAASHSNLNKHFANLNLYTLSKNAHGNRNDGSASAAF